MLPEDIQGQAGASEPEPLLLRPGEAGPGPHEAQLRLWLWLRAAAAHCQDDPGPGLTRLTRSRPLTADVVQLPWPQQPSRVLQTVQTTMTYSHTADLQTPTAADKQLS